MIPNIYKQVIDYIVKHNSEIYLESTENKIPEIFFIFQSFMDNNSSGCGLWVSDFKIDNLNFYNKSSNIFIEIFYINEYYFINNRTKQANRQFKEAKEVFDYIIKVFKDSENN